MAFHERPYVAYLLLADPVSEPLWNWERWFEVFRAFDPVVRMCRDKPAVRVTQSSKDNPREPIKFGRLGWSPSSFEKWVHGSPTAKDRSQVRDFYFVEVAAPSLPISGRDGQPPDFFLVLTNPGYVTRTVPLAFNQQLLVAIAADLPIPANAAGETAINNVQKLITPCLSAKIARPWGFSLGSSGGFTRAIQDLPFTGLFKAGQPHARPVNRETLEESWELLS